MPTACRASCVVICLRFHSAPFRDEVTRSDASPRLACVCLLAAACALHLVWRWKRGAIGGGDRAEDGPAVLAAGDGNEDGDSARMPVVQSHTADADTLITSPATDASTAAAGPPTEGALVASNHIFTTAATAVNPALPGLTVATNAGTYGRICQLHRAFIAKKALKQQEQAERDAARSLERYTRSSPVLAAVAPGDGLQATSPPVLSAGGAPNSNAEADKVVGSDQGAAAAVFEGEDGAPAAWTMDTNTPQSLCSTAAANAAADTSSPLVEGRTLGFASAATEEAGVEESKGETPAFPDDAIIAATTPTMESLANELGARDAMSNARGIAEVLGTLLDAVEARKLEGGDEEPVRTAEQRLDEAEQVPPGAAERTNAAMEMMGATAEFRDGGTTETTPKTEQFKAMEQELGMMAEVLAERLGLEIDMASTGLEKAWLVCFQLRDIGEESPPLSPEVPDDVGESEGDGEGPNHDTVHSTIATPESLVNEVEASGEMPNARELAGAPEGVETYPFAEEEKEPRARAAEQVSGDAQPVAAHDAGTAGAKIQIDPKEIDVTAEVQDGNGAKKGTEEGALEAFRHLAPVAEGIVDEDGSIKPTVGTPVIDEVLEVPKAVDTAAVEGKGGGFMQAGVDGDVAEVGQLGDAEAGTNRTKRGGQRRKYTARERNIKKAIARERAAAEARGHTP